MSFSWGKPLGHPLGHPLFLLNTLQTRHKPAPRPQQHRGSDRSSCPTDPRLRPAPAPRAVPLAAQSGISPSLRHANTLRTLQSHSSTVRLFSLRIIPRITSKILCCAPYIYYKLGVLSQNINCIFWKGKKPTAFSNAFIKRLIDTGRKGFKRARQRRPERRELLVFSSAISPRRGLSLRVG